MDLGYFSQKLGNVMSDNKFDRFVPGFKSGTLDMNSLYKAPYSQKVFARRIERQNKRYNIIIGVDNSGSMYIFQRIKPCVEMVVNLVQALNKNNLEFGVIGYNCRVQWYKEIGKKVDPEVLRKGLLDNTIRSDYTQGSHDWQAVKMAREKLLQLRNTGGQNIVLFFSDGQPSCDYNEFNCNIIGHHHGANIDNLKNEIRELEKIATVFCYGIQTDAPQKYWPHWGKVNNTSDFMELTLKKLGESIKRG